MTVLLNLKLGPIDLIWHSFIHILHFLTLSIFNGQNLFNLRLHLQWSNIELQTSTSLQSQTLTENSKLKLKIEIWY